MEDKRITEQESLLLIQQMINTAKQEQKDDGIGWIVWGWLLFLSSVLTYVNIQQRWFSTYIFWNAFGLFTIAAMLYYVARLLIFKEKERVKTYTREIFKKLNIGFFITIMFMIFAINLGVGPVKGFSILIGLYGFWVLVYGTALNFKPSIIGAYITWAIGFASLFVHRFAFTLADQVQLVMLFHALAVLCGYIIPGHIANKEFKKINRKA